MNLDAPTATLIAPYPDDPGLLLDIDVRGTPKPQGSHQPGVSKAGKPFLREQIKGLPAWREAVRATVAGRLLEHNQPPTLGPVSVTLDFRVARPQSHFDSHGILRERAPRYPIGRNHGDLDKLTRAVFDALTSAGLWRDDSQVVRCDATRRWCTAAEVPGLDLWVRAE